MMSTSGGLNPRAVAGRPSVTRLTQSSWTGIRASGIPRAAVRKMLERDKREKYDMCTISTRPELYYMYKEWLQCYRV